MIAPNVIDMTGPIRGETNIAATIFGALFSTNPRAAKELFQTKILCIIETLCICINRVYENENRNQNESKHIIIFVSLLYIKMSTLCSFVVVGENGCNENSLDGFFFYLFKFLIKINGNFRFKGV